jgi:hypothetical protein
MTIGWNPTHCAPLKPLVLSALLAMWAVAAQGAPSIEVQVGFNGHVLPERYAPVRIRVYNYDGTAAARILVTQTLGSPWRGTATVLQEPTLNIATAGVYHTTIPLYDPLNPILVALIDGEGSTLAEQELDLRSTRRLEPFPVIYGMLPYPLGGRALPVNATELPGDWWAYDVAQSLWISAAPPQESWDAIARWVFAGGTAVLLSGPDYFRFDSPVVRELLPLTDPALAPGPDGGRSLIGAPKPGTETFLRRDGVPLLLVRPYGAGHVALVTVRAADLTQNELELIADSIPASTRLTLTGLSQAMLGALPIVRPGYSAAILLSAGCIVGLGVSVAVGRKHRRGGVAAVLVLFTLLSVLSGLYANGSKSVIEKYSIHTALYLHTWFGSHADAISFLWTRSGQLTHPTLSETVPIQTVPVPAATEPLYALMPQSQVFPALFEHSFLDGSISAPMRSDTHKTFYSYGTSAPTLHLAYDTDADLLILNQESGSEIDDAWFILEGLGFHVTSVPLGTSTYPLDDVHSLRELAATAPQNSTAVLDSLSAVFAFDKGVWFVGHSAQWVKPDEELGRKVRLVTVHVVEGEWND